MPIDKAIKAVNKLSPQICNQTCPLPAPKHLRMPISFDRVKAIPILRLMKLKQAITSITTAVRIRMYKKICLLYYLFRYLH
jgi:hypothetical protein